VTYRRKRYDEEYGYRNRPSTGKASEEEGSINKRPRAEATAEKERRKRTLGTAEYSVTPSLGSPWKPWRAVVQENTAGEKKSIKQRLTF